MAIEIRPVITKKELRTFIHLPAKIHKGHTNWVPPIYMDEWDYFNPDKNLSFRSCDTILALARNGKETVGRIMGIISHAYNRQHNENSARFTCLEVRNDPEVFHALIEFIAKWASGKGMTKLTGPLGFSDKDPQGFLTEGFEQPVSIASNCNFPYMVDLMEKEGFQKKLDLVVYKIDIPAELPLFYKRISERFHLNNSNIKILEFTSRRAVRPYIRPVLRLVNLTFEDIYGFTPFSEEEMDHFANRFLYLINPRFIKIIINEKEEVIAFVIGMSDISSGIRRSKGYLLPIGFIYLLMAARRTRQLNLLLGAIHPDYRGKGLDAIMGTKMLETAKIAGKTTIDTHLELEYNTKVRAEMERLGGKIYKRFRIYEMDLN